MLSKTVNFIDLIELFKQLGFSKNYKLIAYLKQKTFLVFVYLKLHLK